MIEEIGPSLVDAGLVNIAIFLGMAFGVVVVLGVQWAMKTANQTGFKRYYQELTDGRKTEIDSSICAIELNLEQLASMTNTKYFKDWHNKFASFKAYMKQRWLNS